MQEPQENYKTGWIRIFRSIRNHWIWNDPVKFQWWIDILLEVNHSSKKVNIGYNLFDCDRGQAVVSLLNWGKRWNVSKDKARNFLKLLEKDKMITLENLSKTTRLTVCNYDSYQDILHDNQTQAKRKPNASQTQSHTTKNDKNDNNDKNVNKNIPEYSDFLSHALSKKPNVDQEKLKAKYESWIENDWKDGNDKAIKNWKSKLTNTVAFIPEGKNKNTNQQIIPNDGAQRSSRKIPLSKIP